MVIRPKQCKTFVWIVIVYNNIRAGDEQRGLELVKLLLEAV